MEDDVADDMVADMAIMWEVVVMWQVTWQVTSTSTHFWMGPIQLGLISAQYLLLANKIQLIHSPFTKTKVTAQKSQ